MSGHEEKTPGAQQHAALRASNVSKTFGGIKVLDNFNLEIAPGGIHALVGQNGAGKSTLIKILAGYHSPDPGAEILLGDHPLTFGSPASSYALGCRFVHQDLALVDNMSIVDNLFMVSGFPTRFGTVDKRAARRLARDVMETVGLDLPLSAPVSSLRVSERAGVAVARALLAHEGLKPKLMVLDEPTAALPTDEVDSLLTILRSTAASGVGILYVTHHLQEVPGFADHVSVLRDGRLIGTWTTSDVSQSELVHHLIGSELAAELEAGPPDKGPVQSREGEPALSIKSLRSGRLTEFNLDVHAGEIVGIYGPTGSGREDVLRAAFGVSRAEEGTVTVSGKQIPLGRPDRSIASGVGFLPAERRALGGIMGLSARHNLTLLDLKPFFRKGAIRGRDESQEASSWFDRLHVEPRSGEGARLDTFSGGNQQKILFAKWLRLQPSVLLLDEPSQGIDIGAKIEVHRQISAAAQGGTAVVICSSEVEELASLCSRVLVIRDGIVFDDIRGDRVTVSGINLSFHAT